MQSVRIIEIPKCKMVSSGAGFFGEEKFEAFGRWFSALPYSVYPKDFLCSDAAGGVRWLYRYDAALDVPAEFEVVDFEGGLYAVATDIDHKTDIKAMNIEVDQFLAANGLERDECRASMGHIITSPNAQKILSYAQMDYFTPVRPKNQAE